ncbi:MAG: RagB/SusD family nutrient uptake outer membrane protein [Rikenellaceae bacterium]
MKKIFKYLLILGIAFNSTSCDEFLESPTLGSESLDSYFYNESECEKFVVGSYKYIANGSWTPIYMWWIMTDMATDDGWMGSTYQPASYVNFQPVTHYEGGTDVTNNTYLSSFWEVRYKGIAEVNIGIESISEANIGDDLKAQYIAELKVLRAFFYFDLVKNFGGVPLVLKRLSTSESLSYSRSSVSEVYASIEQDLLDAAEVLPYKNSVSYGTGRMNKGIIEALLTKAYLYQEKYDEAYEMALSVINNGGYALEADFNNVWSANDNSSEAIFEIQTSDTQEFVLGNPCPVITGARGDNGWAWGQPTSYLENAFIVAGDTVRQHATIAKNGDIVVGDEDRGAISIPAEWNKSARIVRKFYIPLAERTTPYSVSYNKLNHHVLRYADVLLMAAESAYHKSASDESAARLYLNMVRTRVGLDDVVASGNDLRDAIREERRLELAWEHNRLFDIRRWKTDDGEPMICSIMGANGSFVKYNLEESTDPYETTNSIETSVKGSTFNSTRDLLFPIPYTDVQQSGGLIEQNPGF